MGHQIGYRSYHCSTSEKQILKDLNGFAYDPQETSGYHGNIKFYREPVYKTREEAEEAIRKMDKGWYDDYAVRFREGRRITWLVKCEWHC